MSEKKEIESIQDVIDYISSTVVCKEGTCRECDNARKSVKVLEQVLKNANTVKSISNG